MKTSTVSGLIITVLPARQDACLWLVLHKEGFEWMKDRETFPLSGPRYEHDRINQDLPLKFNFYFVFYNI